MAFFVFFVTADELLESKSQEEKVILQEHAELIAPMTRVKGMFRITSSTISFKPDNEQLSVRGEEVNLAITPPPLPVRTSKTRAAAGSVSKRGSFRHMPSERAMNLRDSYSAPTVGAGSSQVQLAYQVPPETPHYMQSPHASGNLDYEEDGLPKDENGENQFWVTINVCSSSYQQVGGRYRLMSADHTWEMGELREIYYRRYQLRNCALELFFGDDTSWLFQFFDKKKRNKVFDKIIDQKPPNLMENPELFKFSFFYHILVVSVIAIVA